ncbi:hypothetical protein BS50DRAFT_594451 [Corynespora cassiicola Philippines]|uniref:Aminoglycoside phosphotransferase domain-containing protein n=1 Tax=Corynespora cassiicola Philippines TaxID=1448308 RepID=A0A2T2N2B7_CORCC|nr:hypothetical protein BS50DRAFT_594451 [Corynespora cassiicola Philippines]
MDPSEPIDSSGIFSASLAMRQVHTKCPDDKVLQSIASKLFKTPCKKVKIEKMHGGNFNYVTGVDIQEDRSYRQNRYIFRYPCDDSLDFADEVAAILGVRATISFPVPEVVSYDIRKENELGRPYMVQSRIEGTDLVSILNFLSIAQKQSLTKKVISLCNEIASIKSKSPGRYCLQDLSSKKVRIGPLRIPLGRGEKNPLGISTRQQTSLQFMLSLCDAQVTYSKRNASYSQDENVWKAFSMISRSLHRHGFLPDDESFQLCHGDLWPWNILVEVEGPTSVQITGVLDWDFAMFAPGFMYTAPTWLWTTFWGRSVGVSSGPDIPFDKKLQDLRDTWIENTDDVLRKYAIAPECVVARKMFWILCEGLPEENRYAQPHHIIKEWQKIYPQENYMYVLEGRN